MGELSKLTQRTLNCLVMSIFVICFTSPQILAINQDMIAINFKGHVIPGFEKYRDLLEYHPYVIVALKNVGFLNSYNIRVVNANTIHIDGFNKNVIITFKGEKEGVFTYEAEVNVEIAGIDANLILPITVDATRFSNGWISIHIFHHTLNMVPDSLKNVINLKLQALIDPDIQTRLFEYLENLNIESRRKTDIHKTIELIAADADRKRAMRTKNKYSYRATDTWVKILLFSITIFLVAYISLRFRSSKK